MTLITVICNDLIIFSRSKSRIFENSTVSHTVIFRNFRREKIYLPIFVPPFYVRLKTPRSKNSIFPIFAGTNVLSSAKTKLSRILSETL